MYNVKPSTEVLTSSIYYNHPILRRSLIIGVKEITNLKILKEERMGQEALRQSPP